MTLPWWTVQMRSLCECLFLLAMCYGSYSLAWNNATNKMNRGRTTMTIENILPTQAVGIQSLLTHLEHPNGP